MKSKKFVKQSYLEPRVEKKEGLGGFYGFI